MKCKTHTNDEASGMCTECRNLYCDKCLVDINGAYICRECLKFGKGIPLEQENKGCSRNDTVFVTNVESEAYFKRKNDAEKFASIGTCICCILVIILMNA